MDPYAQVLCSKREGEGSQMDFSYSFLNQLNEPSLYMYAGSSQIQYNKSKEDSNQIKNRQHSLLKNEDHRGQDRAQHAWHLSMP
jgi:hypothetical protein